MSSKSRRHNFPVNNWQLICIANIISGQTCSFLIIFKETIREKGSWLLSLVQRFSGTGCHLLLMTLEFDSTISNKIRCGKWQWTARVASFNALCGPDAHDLHNFAIWYLLQQVYARVCLCPFVSWLVCDFSRNNAWIWWKKKSCIYVAGIYELVQIDENPDKRLFTNIRLGLIELKGTVGPW